MSFAAVAPGVSSFRGIWPRKGGETMRIAILICCALCWACTGGAGSALLHDASGSVTGVRVGRLPASDARLADVVRAVGDVVVLDARGPVDVVPADVSRAVDVAIPAVDAAPLLDKGRFVDVLAQDARTVADVQPWGRVDDAGVLHCKYSNGTGEGTSEGCGCGVRVGDGVGVCRKVSAGYLPAPCRWDSTGGAFTWFVKSCADCCGDAL